jgi:two-component system cell cycle sensor histidine kinase/response regulator CckA
MSINAMHAIDGHGQLTLQTSNEPINVTDAKRLGLEPGDYVLLSITDTGSGMDEASKEIIFDPIYSTKGEQGTGLGLSQVYGFMQRSNGAIKVYSELGHGTRFLLYFPRHHETDHKQHSIEENKAVDIRGTETILLVDDEPALLDLSHEILAQKGFNVITAESAKKALDILEHKTVDLLISDIIMPDMNGYQLASIVKEKYPTIKIQLASGFADDRNMGMVDESLQKNLLSKPFNSQELLQRVHNLLNEK